MKPAFVIRLVFFVLIILSGTPNSASAVVPVQTASLSYVAFGDSITFGSYTSYKCTPNRPSLISDPHFETCETPGQSSYFGLLSVFLNTHVVPSVIGSGLGNGYIQNLAVPGNGIYEADCHITPMIAAANDWCGKSTATYMDPNATIVTIAAGINDSQNLDIKFTGAAFCGVNTAPCSDATFTTLWENAFDKLIADIKATAPNARIILVNIPNLAYINGSKQQPDSTCAKGGSGHACGVADRWSRIINAFINAKYSATPDNTTTFNVIDWVCHANRYLQANLNTPNGIHPNDSGHADFAAMASKSIVTPVHPATAAQCALSTPGVKYGTVSPYGPTFNPID